MTSGADSVFLGEGIELSSPVLGSRDVGEMAARNSIAPCHCADSLLIALARFPLEVVEESYRALGGELRAINHGLGLGSTCGRDLGMPSLIEATATPDAVTLKWNPGAADGIPNVLSRLDGATWTKLQERVPRASEERYDDRDVRRGGTYRYRLSFRSEGREQVFAEPVVRVPILTSSTLRVMPNPASAALHIDVVLRPGDPAILEVFDLRGRLLERRRLASVAAGEQVITLRRDLESGIYLVRLEQGGRSESAKAVVVR